MKTNIAFARKNVVEPVLEVSRATKATHAHRAEARLASNRARPALIMVWRIHPKRRRLECRWVVERGAAADEGVSCGELWRRAA
jgi:hypothetical protein